MAWPGDASMCGLRVGPAGDGMDNASDSAMHQHRHDGDEYRRIELIMGAAHRRRWTMAEKTALVAETLRLGVNISDLARRSGVNRGLLQTWRRTAMGKTAERCKVFVPLRLQDGPPTQLDSAGNEATGVSSVREPPPPPSSRLSFVVPGIGTTHGLYISSA